MLPPPTANPTKTSSRSASRLGLYPIVTLQCSSTTVYQVSYHIQSLFFESDNRMYHEARRARTWAGLSSAGSAGGGQRSSSASRRCTTLDP
jgi:hypothetical protein